MSRIAFVDESQRTGFYALAAIAIPHSHVTEVRKALQTIAVRDGQRRRRHFVKEEDRDRKHMLDLFRGLPGASTVCVSTTHTSIPRCRHQLLSTLVTHLLDGGLDRLILDHVDDKQQRRDKQTLWQILGRNSDISFSHEIAHSTEPLLWIPDAIAWCAGRSDWRDQLDGWVTTIRPETTA